MYSKMLIWTLYNQNFYSLSIALLFCVGLGQIGISDDATKGVDVAKEFENIANITSEAKASEVIKLWQDTLSVEDRRELSGMLIDGFASQKTYSGSSFAKSTRHDCSTEAGRCAWILEKLLKMELPPISDKTEPKSLQRATLIAFIVRDGVARTITIKKRTILSKEIALIKKDRNAKVDTTAAKEYQTLLTSDKQASIETLVQQWKKKVASGHVPDILDDVLVENIKSTVQLGPISDLKSSHDLTIEGGRCAWVLEHILGCKLPAITPATDKNERENARQIVIKTFIEIGDKRKATALADARKKAAALSQKEKFASAQSVRTDPMLLSVLAEEQDAAIRCKIAANPRTPINDVAKLMKDSESTVRKIAVDNLSYSRPALSE
jgi:hypothetical protein